MTFNETGRYIFSLCDGRHSKDKIKQLVAKRYGASDSRVGADIDAFLAWAKKEGLITLYGEDEIGIPEKGIGAKSGRSIYWELTRRCNLGCKHCYAAQPLSGDELGLNEIGKILQQAQGMGFTRVAFTGGEPFCREDIMEIVAKAMEHQMEVLLITNATLIDSAIAKKLAKLQPELQVSMDGATGEVYDEIRGEGSFLLFLKGLDNLLQEGLADSIIISFTVMKQNMYSIPALFAFAEERGIRKLHFSWLQRQGNAALNWDYLTLDVKERVKLAIKLHKYIAQYPEFKISGDLYTSYLSNFTHPYLPKRGQLPCPTGLNPYIDAVGYIYGCQLLSEFDYRLGNCREETLEKLLSPSFILCKYEALTLRPWHIEKCKLCRYLPFCRGGCPAETISFYANPLVPSPDCEVAKRMFRYFSRELLVRS